MSRLRMEVKSKPLEFWLFFFCIAYALTNFTNIGLSLELRRTTSLFLGGKVVDFLSIITGFNIVALHKKAKNKDINSGKVLKMDLIDYLPTVFLGVLLTLIIRTWIIGTSLNDLMVLIVASTFELFSLSQFGILPYERFSSNFLLSKAIKNGKYSILWNTPALYISGTIICGCLIYYLINNHENLSKYVLFPIMILLGFIILNMKDMNPDWLRFLNKELIRTLTFILIGCLIYNPLERIKKSRYDSKIKAGFLLLNMVLILYFMISTIIGTKWNDSTNLVFLIPFISVCFIEKDCITRFLNKKVCLYLGNIGIYILTSHMAFVYLVVYLFPNLSSSSLYIAYLTLCFVWANIVYIIDKCVISAWFREDSYLDT